MALDTSVDKVPIPSSWVFAPTYYPSMGENVVIPDRYDGATSLTQFAANRGQEVDPDEPQTFYADTRVLGQGESINGNYILTTGDSLGNYGYLFRFRTISAVECLSFVGDSTSDSNPSAHCNTGDITSGNVQHVAITYDGGVLVSGLKFFGAENAASIRPFSILSSTNGSGIPYVGTGYPIVLGNNGGGSRTFNGDIFRIARWRRILTIDELRSVQMFGPESCPDKLFFHWANGRDWVSGLKPMIRTAITQGPPSPYVAMLT